MDQLVHIVQAVMIIPAIGIAGGIVAGVIKMILRHEEKRAEIKAGSVGAGNESLRSEFEALRQELARLRDTSTQYDISIQHTLESLERRVGTLESSKHSASPAVQVSGEETAPVVNRTA